MPKNNSPLEADECRAFVDWLAIQENLGRVKVFSHIPSETFTRSWTAKARNTALGVRRGVPDYFIVTPGNLVAVEMKRQKGGTVAEEQREWITSLNEAGVPAKVCCGADEAIAFTAEYLPSS